jgi:hypothetical protein
MTTVATKIPASTIAKAMAKQLAGQIEQTGKSNS